MTFSEAESGYTIYGIGRRGSKEIVGRHYPWFAVFVQSDRAERAVMELKKLRGVVDAAVVRGMVPVIPAYPYRLQPDPSRVVIRVAAERKEYVPYLARTAQRVLGPGTYAGVYNIVYGVRAAYDSGMRFFTEGEPLLFTPEKDFEAAVIEVIKQSSNLKIMSFDIEVATVPGRFPRPGDPIISVQYAVTRLDDTSIADPSWPKDNVVTLIAGSKAESADLVADFIEAVKRERPDFLVGYNSAYFDVRYMRPFMPEGVRFRDPHHLALPVLEFPHIDLMIARDRMGSSLGVRSQRARSLVDVVKEVVRGSPFEWVTDSDLMAAEEKLDHTKLVREWERRTDLFHSYIVADAYLTLILAYLWMPTIVLLSAATHIAPTVLSRLNTGQVAEYVLVRWYEHLGLEPVVLERSREIKKVKDTSPLRGITERADLFTKGKVFVASYGVEEGVAEGDFSQLYPTLMANDALDPTAVRALVAAELRGRRVIRRYADPVAKLRVKEKGFDVVLGQAPITKEGMVKKNADYMEPTEYYFVVPTYGPASFLVYKMFMMRRITKKLKKRAKEEGRPELAAADQAVKILNNCYPPWVRVATPKGLIPISELRVGDEVFAYDLETGEVKLTKVRATWRYGYSGPLYMLVTEAGTLVATPEQNIVVAGSSGPRLVPIKDAGTMVTVPSGRPWLGLGVDWPLLKYAEGEIEKAPPPREWAGHYRPPVLARVREGGAYTYLVPEPETLAWVSGLVAAGGEVEDGAVVVHLPKSERIVKAFEKLREITGAVEMTASAIVIRSPTLARYLSEEVLRRRIRVPRWVITAPPRARRAFLDGVRHAVPSPTGSYYVRDEGLAEGIALLLATLGRNTRIECGDGACIVVEKGEVAGAVKRIYYSGQVYDVSTDYGTIIAGEGGLIPTGQSLYGSFSKRRGFINQVLAAYIFWKTLNILYDVISYTEREVRKRVLYGDTDSVFVKLGRRPKDEIVREFTESILPRLNEYVRRRYGREYEIKYEDSFDFCVYPKQKHGGRASKKTYICCDYGPDGSPVVKIIKGEFFKTTAPVGLKEKLPEFYAEILKRKPSSPEEVTRILREFLAREPPIKYFVKKIVDSFEAEVRPDEESMYVYKIKNLNKPFHYAALHIAYALSFPGVNVEAESEGSVAFTVDVKEVLTTGDIVVHYIPTNDPRHFYVYMDHDPETGETVVHEVRVKELRIVAEREDGLIKHTGYWVIETYRELRLSKEDVLDLVSRYMRKYVVDDVFSKLVPALMRWGEGPLEKYMGK